MRRYAYVKIEIYITHTNYEFNKNLDPTFLPPIINKTCSWQKKLVKEICKDILPEVIETSTNQVTLDRLFRTLQLIESDTIN